MKSKSYQPTKEEILCDLQEPDDLEMLSDLLHPELFNVLKPGLVQHIEISMTEISSETEEGKIIARYGLVPPNSSHDPDTAPAVGVKSWVLNMDSYSTNCAGQSFETQMLRTELDKVAARAYAFFRWSVREKFLKRFGVK